MKANHAQSGLDTLHPVATARCWRQAGQGQTTQYVLRCCLKIVFCSRVELSMKGFGFVSNDTSVVNEGSHALPKQHGPVCDELTIYSLLAIVNQGF